MVGYLASLAAGRRMAAWTSACSPPSAPPCSPCATLLIAWFGRDRFREWAWLVYPLLVCIGLKMVAQDFKHSRPATLFIALASTVLRSSSRRACEGR